MIFTVFQIHAHQGRLVIAMQDVDEICNGQHTCETKGFMFQFPQTYTSQFVLVLPTNLCNSLSHNGAALKPFATSA